jgi:hypothetical protein
MLKEAEQRLKATIEANDPGGKDECGQAVYRRLLEHPGAAASFAAIRPDGMRWDVLLTNCITAERIARTQRKIVAGARKSCKEAEKAATDLKRLAEFFDKRISVPDGQSNPIADAIDLLGHEISSIRRYAERFLSERSRKADVEAQRSAGIGWIKESVRRLSGKPYLEDVRVLAEATLGCEVTLDSVNKAVMPDDALWFGYRVAKAGWSQFGPFGPWETVRIGQTVLRIRHVIRRLAHSARKKSSE